MTIINWLGLGMWVVVILWMVIFLYGVWYDLRKSIKKKKVKEKARLLARTDDVASSIKPIKPIVQWQGAWRQENRANGSETSSLRLTATDDYVLEFKIQTTSAQETKELGIIRGNKSFYLPKGWTVA